MARRRHLPQPGTDFALRFYDIDPPAQKSKKKAVDASAARFANGSNSRTFAIAVYCIAQRDQMEAASNTSYWLDILALVYFFIVWALYSHTTANGFAGRKSLTYEMNQARRQWMATMSTRELRMIDTSIMIGLQQGTGFFASTSILAIGGCFGLLNSSGRVLTLFHDLPFLGDTTQQLFETKILGLLVLFAYAFFKFAWSYRLFNYCSILIGSVPMARDKGPDDPVVIAGINRAAGINIQAGEHFNSGLRGIFFSIGYLGWFLHPLLFMITTTLVAIVLLRRQFFSRAREVLMQNSVNPGL